MDIIELLKVIFLGIVEGITEWLPVSSTGHMILVDQFMKLKVSEEFWQMFLVVIQLGAVLAVVVLDFKKLCHFIKMIRPERVTGTISVRMSVSGNYRNLQTNTST